MRSSRRSAGSSPVGSARAGGLRPPLRCSWSRARCSAGSRRPRCRRSLWPGGSTAQWLGIQRAGSPAWRCCAGSRTPDRRHPRLPSAHSSQSQRQPWRFRFSLAGSSRNPAGRHSSNRRRRRRWCFWPRPRSGWRSPGWPRSATCPALTGGETAPGWSCSRCWSAWWRSLRCRRPARSRSRSRSSSACCSCRSSSSA